MSFRDRFDIDSMRYKPKQIIQTNDHYFQADCWGILHQIKKSDLPKLRSDKT